jgi:hypothetical protein
MGAANPLWGALGSHGELGKLGIEVSERTVRLLRQRRRPPSQTWRTFLTNHVTSLVSIDFFTVPTLTGRVLFVLVLLTHRRRRIVHLTITEHPTAAWTAQQVIDAFPDDTAPRWLLRDRDAIYGDVFRRRVAGMGIAEVITSPSSPWQNPYAERVIGSLRRECLGPRHHSEPEAFASHACSIRLLLSWGENSSLPRENRACASTRPSADRRSRSGVRGSRWTSPSVRATRSLTRWVRPRMAHSPDTRDPSPREQAHPRHVTSRHVGNRIRNVWSSEKRSTVPKPTPDHYWRTTIASSCGAAAIEPYLRNGRCESCCHSRDAASARE